MLFPSAVPTSDVKMPSDYNHKYDKFLHHIVDSCEKLTAQGSQTFSALRKGQLIFHTLNRPLSETHLMQLATLARLTHDKHFNTRKYTRQEIMVPGGLSFALTCSLASRDLHEVLYEDLVACTFPNNLCPGETVSSSIVRMLLHIYLCDRSI
jgi:citrate lyase subunit beta/citryl-CoA lyase